MARYLDVLNLLIVLFRSSASLIFCFLILSAIERGVFKLLTVVVDLSILVPSSFALYWLWVHITLQFAVFS